MSWAAFVICLLFTGAARVLDPLFVDPELRLLGLLIYFVAFAVAFGGTMWLSSVTVLRNRRVQPVPVALVAAVGFVGGAVLVASLDLIASVLGLVGSGYVPHPWLFAAITCAFALCSLAYLLDARDRFRSERDRLLAKLARTVANDASEHAALDRLRSQMMQYADRDAALTFRAASVNVVESEDSLGEARSAVVALRSTSDLALRSISHGIWAPESHARLRPMMAVRALAVQQPYRLILLAFPLFVFTTLRLTQSQPVAIQFLSLMVLAAYGIAVSFVVNAATRRLPKYAVAAVIGSVPVLALSCVPLYFALVSAGVDDGMALRLGLAGAVWLGGTYPLFNLARGLSLASQDVTRGLRQSITEGDLRRAGRARDVEALRREIAMHLHGTVRGLLTTTVMRLEFAISSQDPEQASLALAEARSLLERGVRPHPMSARPESLLVELAGLESAWEGLISLRINADEAGVPSAQTQRALVSVVTEGVNDAARHGRATRVDVTIREMPDGWQVIVDDDGTFENGSDGSPPGLGGRYFDAVAPSDWNRARTSDGATRLSVRIRDRAV